MQKAGRQAKAQSQFALMGSLARVLFPVLAGYFEQYVNTRSCFGFNLLVVSSSVMGIMFFYDKILFFTVDNNGNNNNNNNNDYNNNLNNINNINDNNNKKKKVLKNFSIFKMNKLSNIDNDSLLVITKKKIKKFSFFEMNKFQWCVIFICIFFCFVSIGSISDIA